MYNKIHLYRPLSEPSLDARLHKIMRQWYCNKVKMHRLFLAIAENRQQYDLIVGQHRRVQKKLIRAFEVIQVEFESLKP